MSDRRVSKEELEAFWRGDKDTYQRMYSQRMQLKANEAEKQGKQITYISNDGSATLPEVSVTAPKETEELRQAKLKLDYENLADNAITIAGFIPGADTFADIADIGNSWRKGDYSGMLWGVRGQGLVPAYKARAYTTSDKGVMPILYDKNAKIVNTDMQGKSWYKLSYNGNTVRTNDIVDDLFNKGNDIVQMDNVLDPGPNLIPSNSKYLLFKDRLDQLTMGMFPQNNVILKPGVIRKSLLGNNGDFDKSNLNLYRKKGGKL